VEETMQPEHAILWLRAAQPSRPQDTRWGTATRRLPATAHRARSVTAYRGTAEEASSRTQCCPP